MLTIDIGIFTQSSTDDEENWRNFPTLSKKASCHTKDDMNLKKLRVGMVRTISKLELWFVGPPHLSATPPISQPQ